MADGLGPVDPVVIAKARAEAVARETEIISEMARRVHTVMCNFAETLVRKNPSKDGTVSNVDSQSLIHGAISGVAVMVARMALSRNPDADPDDQRTPEEFYAETLMQQFVHTYRDVQRQDAEAAMAGGILKV
jgi:hypothetical protein